MKHVPDMDHLRPDLQIDRDIGGAGELGEANRIVEQDLCRTHLYQQRRQPAQIGVERRGERRTRYAAFFVSCTCKVSAMERC